MWALVKKDEGFKVGEFIIVKGEKFRIKQQGKIKALSKLGL